MAIEEFRKNQKNKFSNDQENGGGRHTELMKV